MNNAGPHMIIVLEMISCVSPVGVLKVDFQEVCIFIIHGVLSSNR